VAQHLPDDEAIARAGAPRSAKAIARAVELYRQAQQASAQVRQARQQVAAARLRDQQEHVAAVEGDPGSKLTARHEDKARRSLQDAERREAALKAAYVRSMEALGDVVGEERAQIAGYAVRERDLAVEQAAEIAAAARALVERLGAALASERWASGRHEHHWKVALQRRDVRPNVEIGMVLDYLDRIATVLAEQETTAERQEREQREASQAAATNLSGFIGA
jgi:hypothetical protein